MSRNHLYHGPIFRKNEFYVFDVAKDEIILEAVVLQYFPSLGGSEVIFQKISNKSNRKNALPLKQILTDGTINTNAPFLNYGPIRFPMRLAQPIMS